MSSLVAYGDSSAEDSEEGSDNDVEKIKNEIINKLDDGNNFDLKRSISESDSSSRYQDEPPIKKTLLEGKKSEDTEERDLMKPGAGKDQLCLPVEIQSMFNQTNRWIDDPTKHENRARSFPHVEGNWATHVYIPVPEDTRFISCVHNIVDFFKPFKFHVMCEYHISLSRTVVIRYHWIESLLESLRQNLSSLEGCLADIISVKLYTNDEKTRTFICLEVSSDDTFFPDYIKAVDKSFAEFKLPAYYKDPSFHISIGWCTGDVRDRISDDTLLNAKEMLATFCASNPDLSVVFSRQICFQSGNKSFLIPLKDADI